MMNSDGYRESLRRLRPRVFVDGDAIASVVDEPRLAPGVNAIGVTYDLAYVAEHEHVMKARQARAGSS